MGVVVRSALWGAAIGAVLLAAFAIVVAVAVLSVQDRPLLMTITEILVFAVVWGGLPGAVIGTGVGVVRRAVRRRKPAHPPLPQQSYDMWSEVVEICGESTRRVVAAVRTVPKSPAKDWLVRISEQLTKELDDVRGIAQLGRALGAVDRQHPVYQRLVQAAQDFQQFENELGRVALQIHPDLNEARTHLEVLEKQLPQLSA